MRPQFPGAMGGRGQARAVAVRGGPVAPAVRHDCSVSTVPRCPVTCSPSGRQVPRGTAAGPATPRVAVAAGTITSCPRHGSSPTTAAMTAPTVCRSPRPPSTDTSSTTSPRTTGRTSPARAPAPTPTAPATGARTSDSACATRSSKATSRSWRKAWPLTTSAIRCCGCRSGASSTLTMPAACSTALTSPTPRV